MYILIPSCVKKEGGEFFYERSASPFHQKAGEQAVNHSAADPQVTLPTACDYRSEQKINTLYLAACIQLCVHGFSQALGIHCKCSGTHVCLGISLRAVVWIYDIFDNNSMCKFTKHLKGYLLVGI